MAKSVDSVNKTRGAGADALLEAVHAVTHLYRSHQFRALREGAQPLTHMEARVLGYLARHPGSTLSDLVAHSGRDKGQLARLVGGLRERGLLEARTDEADRRAQRLHPTEAGLEAQQVLARQGRRVATVAVQGLSTDERRQLAELLERVRRNLEGSGEA